MAQVLAVISDSISSTSICGIQLDINEYRLGPHPRHHIRARRKTHRRNDHLIAQPDAGDLERHLSPAVAEVMTRT